MEPKYVFKTCFKDERNETLFSRVFSKRRLGCMCINLDYKIKNNMPSKGQEMVLLLYNIKI